MSPTDPFPDGLPAPRSTGRGTWQAGKGENARIAHKASDDVVRSDGQASWSTESLRSIVSTATERRRRGWEVEGPTEESGSHLLRRCHPHRPRSAGRECSRGFSSGVVVSAWLSAVVLRGRTALEAAVPGSRRGRRRGLRRQGTRGRGGETRCTGEQPDGLPGLRWQTLSGSGRRAACQPHSRSSPNSGEPNRPVRTALLRATETSGTAPTARTIGLRFSSGVCGL